MTWPANRAGSGYRIRVLHVQKANGLAGSERHLLQLLPALAKRGVDVRMLVLGAGQSERFASAMCDRGVPTSSIPAGHDVNPKLIVQLMGEIARQDPDIVHTHLIHADVYGQAAARLRHKRGVSSVHGTHPFYRKEPFRSAARLAGHLASRTIAISAYTGDFVSRMRIAPHDRIRVIHYGIDWSDWLAGPDERRRFRSGLGLAQNDIAIVVASRLVPGKGHDVAIRAFSEVASQVPTAKLILAGDGPIRQELETLARRNIRDQAVSFLGFVQDVRSVLCACDMALFPSLASPGEGFGLAALEAMAAALPVVASDIGPLPEVVADGESGFVVQAGHAESWSKAILMLSRDEQLRTRLGAKAQERAREHFSVEEMVRRTIDVYDEALRDGQTPVVSGSRA